MARTAFFLAGTAKGDLVQHGDIVLNDGGFANDESGAVVQQDTTANLRGGVNIHAEHLTADTLEEQRHHVALLLPEKMRHAIGGQRMKALEEKQRFQRIVTGSIALHHGLQIRRHALHHHRILLQQRADERLQIIALHIAPGKLACQAHRHGVAQ